MTRLTRPAFFSASAKEPPIRPQPIRPSWLNMVDILVNSVRVQRVAAEHLEEGTLGAQLVERGGHVVLGGVAGQVDEEDVLPLTRAGRARRPGGCPPRRPGWCNRGR